MDFSAGFDVERDVGRLDDAALEGGGDRVARGAAGCQGSASIGATLRTPPESHAEVIHQMNGAETAAPELP